MREFTVLVPEPADDEGLAATTLLGDQIFAFQGFLTQNLVVIIVDMHHITEDEPRTVVLTLTQEEWRKLQAHKPTSISALESL